MENESCELAYIYGLVDPRNNEIRYIGKTKNPKSRLSGHITESKDIKVVNYRIKWIRKLISLGLKPKIVFLKICSISNFVKYETEYIKLYSSGRLTNSDETGQGNTNRKREVLNRQSENSSRKVYQYDLNGNFIKEYRSVRDAATQLKTNHSNISRCCNAKYNHSKGFIFRYDKLIILEKVESPNAVKKTVIELDIDGHEINRWNSIMDCSRDTEIDHGNLSKVCNGKLKSIKKRFFKFSHLIS
jgi:hypothetical protein